ncbi:hypothetical protein BC835DRAFT_901554 [Cytidiella melzeri]|nr:hypothetical protein BC835DRAFT_901554 [Cytidiella melzeri]
MTCWLWSSATASQRRPAPAPVHVRCMFQTSRRSLTPDVSSQRPSATQLSRNVTHDLDGFQTHNNSRISSQTAWFHRKISGSCTGCKLRVDSKA